MIYWSEDRKFVEREFIRMGFDKDARWRISDTNKDFELCNTYPRFFIIPSSFKDEDLDSVAKFRYFRRIPTAVWRHIKNGCFIVRSSQPTVGWFGWFRNELDEMLVQSYVNNTMPNSERTDDNNARQDESVDNNDDPCDQQSLVEDNDEQRTPQHTTSTTTTTTTTITTTHLSQHLQKIQQNHNNNFQDTTTKVVMSEYGRTPTSRLDSNHDLDNETNSETSASTQSTTTPITPMTTNGNGTSPADSNLLLSNESNTTATAPTSKMLIIDARSYTAAMANRAKGGGCECSEYYQRCEVQFMNLANIHSIRKSFHAIRSVCEAYSEQSNK